MAQHVRRRRGFYESREALAICKAVIERHQGTISVASTGGAGTTVTAQIPLSPLSARTAASS